MNIQSVTENPSLPSSLIAIFPKDLLISAELALGEAYMRKDIEIEGDLFKALCVVLGHVGKDSINRKVLSSLFNAGLKKKDQKQQVSSPL